MPTYQYKREDGTTFEIVQKISEEALKTCPETGQKVKRIITGGGGVVYKGDGWYVTDYKNKSNGSSNAPDGKHGKRSDSTNNGQNKTAGSSGDSSSNSNQNADKNTDTGKT